MVGGYNSSNTSHLVELCEEVLPTWFIRGVDEFGEDGSIAHAQLTFGNGMIMLGSVAGKESNWGRTIKQPDEIGGAETQSAYLIVADADMLYERAKAAGAEILLQIRDEDYGGRGFICRDLEGHVWSFGTYDPW